jgi:hypothetical protein
MQTVLGKDLQPGDIVHDWDDATVENTVVELSPSVMVWCDTDHGTRMCGKRAELTVTRSE